MTASGFRKIALALTGAIESAHMGHPDFRVGGRIFATLRKGLKFGMVVLTPEQQQELLRDHAGSFAPESGAWGRAGCTKVDLALVDAETLGHALTLARQNAVERNAAKRPQARGKKRKSSSD